MYWKEWNLENQTTKHYSRFWCVHGFGAVADVLCGMKYSESQTSQEIPRWQETCHRSQLKTGTVYRQKEKTEKLLIKTENTKKLRAAHLKHTYKQCSEYIYIYVSYIKPHIQKSTSLEDMHTHLNTPGITIGNLRETQRQSKPNQRSIKYTVSKTTNSNGRPLRTLQKTGDVLELRDVILTETTVIHQEWEDVVEFTTRMGWV